MALRLSKRDVLSDRISLRGVRSSSSAMPASLRIKSEGISFSLGTRPPPVVIVVFISLPRSSRTGETTSTTFSGCVFLIRALRIFSAASLRFLIGSRGFFSAMRAYSSSDISLKVNFSALADQRMSPPDARSDNPALALGDDIRIISRISSLDFLISSKRLPAFVLSTARTSSATLVTALRLTSSSNGKSGKSRFPLPVKIQACNSSICFSLALSWPRKILLAEGNLPAKISAPCSVGLPVS